MSVSKMNPAFSKLEGGLFSEVEKADVGNSYQELQKQGVDLMAWADPFMPDKALPPHIEAAAIEALASPVGAHYTAPVGDEELKKALAVKLKQQNHLDVDPNRNILITPGSDSGLFYAMLPFINPGDEVIIPSPSYPNNFLNPQIMHGKTIPLLLKEEDHFQFNKEELEKVITLKTKMIVLTHPNNPTTTVFNRKSLEILRECVIKHDLILVCDQAFEDFIYDGREMITPASMEGMFERTISVFSVSKGMGLSGFRVGYIVASAQMMDKYYAGAVSVIGATSTVAQKAILAALKDSRFMNEFYEAFDYRRKQAFDIFNSIEQVSMEMPESGFLCWLNVSKLGDSSEICSYLLKHARVSINDGINYGPNGKGHLRIVLGVYRDSERVISALLRMKEALIQFKQERSNSFIL